MTKAQCDQIARIIRAVFEYEEQVDPRTVAMMFEYIGRLIPCDEDEDDYTEYDCD